jgi:VanZ family protein
MVPQRGGAERERAARDAMLSFRTLWWSLGGLGVAIVLVLSLMPEPPALPGDTEGWAGHVLAYGTMMAWFARLAPAGRQRLAAAVALCLLGVAIEYAQRATGYRTFDVADMLADALGVAAGWLLSPPRAPDGIAPLDRALARWMQREDRSPP